MASDEANVRLTADDREALAAWAKQLQAVERLDKKIDALGNNAKKSVEGAASSFKAWAVGLVTVDKGLSLAQAALHRFVEENRKLQNLQKESSVSRSETFTRFVVQSGIAQIADPKARATAEREAKEKINAAALEAGVPLTQADQAATQLVSTHGVSPEMVLDGGLGSFLKTLQAAGAMGKETDPSEMAAAAMRFMSATGQDATAENFDKTLLAIHQMRKDGNLEFRDMNRFSAEAGSLTQLGHIGPDRQLAMFARLLDNMEPEMAAVSWRTMTEHLATAGAQPVRVRALQKMWLRPSDVDMVPNKPGASESFEDVVEKLTKGLQKVPEAERNRVISDLFGDRGMRAALAFMQPGFRQDVEQRVGTLTNRQERDRDIQAATQSTAAKVQTEKSRAEIALDTDQGAKSAVLEEAMRARSMERYEKGELSALRIWLQETITSSARGLGASSEASAVMGVQGAGLLFGNMTGRIGAGSLNEGDQQQIIESFRAAGVRTPQSEAERRMTEQLRSDTGDPNAEIMSRRRWQEKQSSDGRPAPNQGASTNSDSAARLAQAIERQNTLIEDQTRRLELAMRSPQAISLRDDGRQFQGVKTVESLNG